MTNIKDQHRKAKELFFQQLIIFWQEYDFNKKMIWQIEEKCHFIRNYHLILFPNGDEQVMEEFGAWQDQKMLNILSEVEKSSKIRLKIARALEIRIIEIVPKNIIFKQKAWFLLPSHLPLSVKCQARTCDLIWKYAGDESDDFNYYIKRSLLHAVYIAASMFYISDESQNFTKTKEFISISLDNIINVAGALNKIKIPTIKDIPFLRMYW